MPPTRPGEEAGSRVIEQGRRLSDSGLWALQRRYYERIGIAAWSERKLPHYVTSNPQIARAVAKMVQGFLRDCLASPDFDPSRPVTIVELAAGSGRFGFYLLKELRKLAAAPPLSHLRVRLIMTDLSEATIGTWRHHPSFAPFVAGGALDFARFDMERDADLTTIVSGETLSAGSAGNPMVFIANYAFDSLKQDAFIIADGRVKEGRVKLTAAQPTRLADLAELPDLTLDFDGVECVGDFYKDRELDRIVRDYGRCLGDTTLLMPVGALSCVAALQRLSGGRMLLLAADKGLATEEDLIDHRTPSLVAHGGCFSFMVNFNAIARFVGGRGGAALLPTVKSHSLQVAAYVLGFDAADLSDTRAAYAEHGQSCGPDDLFTVTQSLWRLADALTLSEIVAFLRSTGHDPTSFVGCAEPLIKALIEEKPARADEIRRLVDATWDNYFLIGEDVDLAFMLASCLYQIGYYEHALRYLEHSLALHGPHAKTYINIAECCHILCRFAPGIAAIEQALALDPDAVAGARAAHQAARGGRPCVTSRGKKPPPTSACRSEVMQA